MGARAYIRVGVLVISKLKLYGYPRSKTFQLGVKILSWLIVVVRVSGSKPVVAVSPKTVNFDLVSGLFPRVAAAEIVFPRVLAF